MYEAIQWLSAHHAFEILLALGVVLLLVDYFFRTDVPAHFGYLCFAGALFFALPLTVTSSLIAGIGAFALLEILHRVCFSRFLTNAPGTERPAADEA